MTTNDPLFILKKYWGYDSFRYPQEEVIQSVLAGKDTLALLPTGGGKSLCFQLPAMLKEGICIVISPLVALIKDQVEGLKRKGIKALSLAGGISHDDLERILNNAIYGNYKFLYLSPERLQQDIVQEFIKSMNVNIIAIDEAHCISQWGHDFRPAYLGCVWLKEAHPQATVIALSASATLKVQYDILAQLHIPEAKIITSSLKRPNIAYMVYETQDKWGRLERILTKNNGSSVVYLRSRKGTIKIADFLISKGISATFFHGGLTADDKAKRLSMWLMNDVQVMVATNAFGMGIDKPDVRTVIHWDIPSTLEDYFQEAGRAGRDGKKAFAVMLYDGNDFQKTKKQLQQNLPTIDFLKLLYAKLNAYFKIAYGEGQETTHFLNVPEFCERYKLNGKQVYNGLNVLDRMSIITKNDNFHNRTMLQFKASPKEVLQYSQQQQKSLSDFIQYILRTYPGIFEQMTPLNIEKLMERLNIKTIESKQFLEKLVNDELIEYFAENTDTEIMFNVPRDDDRTINTVAKPIKKYSKSKKKSQESMFQFIENTAICKSIQLLTYFGEKETQPCGICSVCIARKKSPSDCNEIKKQIIDKLKAKPMSSHQLCMELNFSEFEILPCLEELHHHQKIMINTFNQYIIYER